MCTRVIGKMIKHMEKAYTSIKMVQVILANGFKMFSMAMELKNGSMVPPTKGKQFFYVDITKMEQRMGMESSIGPITLTIRVISSIISSRGMERWYFQMETYTRVPGKTIECMERVNSNGLMVVIMRVNTSMTRNKVMVVFKYLMVVFMRGNGKMVFSMGLANTGIEMASGRRAYGRMERISNELIYNYDDDHLQKFPFCFEY